MDWQLGLIFFLLLSATSAAEFPKDHTTVWCFARDELQRKLETDFKEAGLATADISFLDSKTYYVDDSPSLGLNSKRVYSDFLTKLEQTYNNFSAAQTPATTAWSALKRFDNTAAAFSSYREALELPVAAAIRTDMEKTGLQKLETVMTFDRIGQYNGPGALYQELLRKELADAEILDRTDAEFESYSLTYENLAAEVEAQKLLRANCTKVSVISLVSCFDNFVLFGLVCAVDMKECPDALYCKITADNKLKQLNTPPLTLGRALLELKTYGTFSKLKNRYAAFNGFLDQAARQRASLVFDLESGLQATNLELDGTKSRNLEQVTPEAVSSIYQHSRQKLLDFLKAGNQLYFSPAQELSAANDRLEKLVGELEAIKSESGIYSQTEPEYLLRQLDGLNTLVTDVKKVNASIGALEETAELLQAEADSAISSKIVSLTSNPSVSQTELDILAARYRSLSTSADGRSIMARYELLKELDKLEEGASQRTKSESAYLLLDVDLLDFQLKVAEASLLRTFVRNGVSYSGEGVAVSDLLADAGQLRKEIENATSKVELVAAGFKVAWLRDRLFEKIDAVHAVSLNGKRQKVLSTWLAYKTAFGNHETLASRISKYEYFAVDNWVSARDAWGFMAFLDDYYEDLSKELMAEMTTRKEFYFSTGNFTFSTNLLEQPESNKPVLVRLAGSFSNTLPISSDVRTMYLRLPFEPAKTITSLNVIERSENIISISSEKDVLTVRLAIPEKSDSEFLLEYYSVPLVTLNTTDSESISEAAYEVTKTGTVSCLAKLPHVTAAFEFPFALGSAIIDAPTSFEIVGTKLFLEDSCIENHPITAKATYLDPIEIWESSNNTAGKIRKALKITNKLPTTLRSVSLHYPVGASATKISFQQPGAVIHLQQFGDTIQWNDWFKPLESKEALLEFTLGEEDLSLLEEQLQGVLDSVRCDSCCGYAERLRAQLAAARSRPLEERLVLERALLNQATKDSQLLLSLANENSENLTSEKLETALCSGDFEGALAELRKLKAKPKLPCTSVQSQTVLLRRSVSLLEKRIGRLAALEGWQPKTFNKTAIQRQNELERLKAVLITTEQSCDLEKLDSTAASLVGLETALAVDEKHYATILWESRSWNASSLNMTLASSKIDKVENVFGKLKDQWSVDETPSRFDELFAQGDFASALDVALAEGISRKSWAENLKQESKNYIELAAVKVSRLEKQSTNSTGLAALRSDFQAAKAAYGKGQFMDALYGALYVTLLAEEQLPLSSPFDFRILWAAGGIALLVLIVYSRKPKKKEIVSKYEDDFGELK